MGDKEDESKNSLISISASDIFGLSKPLEKLVDVLAKGLGRRYVPKGIREQADAEAYKLKVLAAAQAEAEAIAVGNEVKVAAYRIEQFSGDDTELISRAKRRLLEREIEGQLNVEAIAEQAAANMPPSVSPAPISEDWRRKFFVEAENVCEADMQALWGKVLAGEVSAPGSYSLRTLDVLRQLSKPEAEAFRVAANLANSSGVIFEPHRNGKGITKFGLDYGVRLLLRESGLLHDGDSLLRTWAGISDEHTEDAFYIGAQPVLINRPSLKDLEIPSLALTKAGMELSRLIEKETPEEYVREVLNMFRTHKCKVKKGTEVKEDSGRTALRFPDEWEEE